MAEPRAATGRRPCTSRGGPSRSSPDRALLDEIAEVRRVVELGRQARSSSRLKLRQPLRRLVVAGASPARRRHADEIADELRVKEVEFGEVEASELRVKPNLPVLGPKLGAGAARGARALQRGEFEELDGGRFRVDGHVLEPDEVLVERIGLEGWAVASEDGVTVALDTALDDELLLEGRLYDRIHEVNVLRKERGSRSPTASASGSPTRSCVERFGDRIAAETLAVAVELGRAPGREGVSGRLGRGGARAARAPAAARRSEAKPKDDPAQGRRRSARPDHGATTTRRPGATSIRRISASRRSRSTSAARRARR